MRKFIVVLIALTVCITLLPVALEAQGPASYPNGNFSMGSAPEANPCEYTGIIKEVSLKHDLIAVETTAGLIEFKYKPDDKKECILLKELKVADNVKVSCKNEKDTKEKKKYLKATCVVKIPTNPPPTMRININHGGLNSRS